MSINATVALLVILTIAEVICSGNRGEIHRCKCINYEKKPIGRFIGKVEVIPANSHCSETEIIGTLKKNGEKICLHPKAPWVQKVLQRILAEQSP